MSTLTSLIEDLKALEGKATPGPWDAYHEQGLRPFLATYEIIEGGFRKLTGAVDIRLMHELEFIAASRNNLKKLLTIIEIYREALEMIGFNEAPIENIALANKERAVEAIEQAEKLASGDAEGAGE